MKNTNMKSEWEICMARYFPERLTI